MRRGLLIFVAVLVLVGLAASSRFYTDVLWFNEIGFSSVLWTSLATQFAVGAIVMVVVTAVVAANLFLASRVAPPYALGVARRADPFEAYREWIAHHLAWIHVALAAAVGLMLALGAASAWRTFLLWSNRVTFGRRDPQFNKDVGFYVFELPFIDLLLNMAWVALFATVVLSLGAHYFHGSIRPELGWRGVHPPALAHVSVLLGMLALVKAAQYWLGTYELNFSPRGVVTGASYTDVHAQLPALRLLAVISIISAVLFVVNIRFRRLSLPAAAVGIWILFAVFAGAVWPWAVQRFSVDPQEPQRERPFIERNIEATRAAFGLSDVREQSFPAAGELSGQDVNANSDLLQNVRLWDPDVLQDVYGQVQAIRPYYQFRDVDIDRYEVDGRMRQVLLSPRELELDALSGGSQTWSNLHLQYTHGFGLAASLANESTRAGQPEFLVKDLPGTVDAGAESFRLDQPRLYYGEAFRSRQYSVVASKQKELDFPVGEGARRNSYDGRGGIRVGGLFRRLAFAIREGDPNLVLSNVITPQSKILLYRNIRSRVSRVAPFLALDHDPYLAAVDGRLVWLLDAYTTTRWYPYSQRFNVGELVQTSTSGTLTGNQNYIRNSVKVAVDAYDGTMRFYIVDENDPLIRAWRNAFPELFATEDPPSALSAHFRYPEDLFKVQSDVYRNYHISDALDFYSREDAWDVARRFREGIPEAVPATYLLIRLPGETQEEFVLSRPFTPRGKNNMISLLLGRSDPGRYGELVRLQFPRQRVVLGPLQIHNLINQDVQISQTLSLLRQRGSRVEFGSLVILPIGDSILYVQPLFVIAEEIGIPELKKVFVAQGERVLMADSLGQGLEQLFGLEQQPAAPPRAGPQPPPTPTRRPDSLRAVLDDASRIYQRAQRALAAGDFETYARLIERLGRVLQRAESGAS